MRRRQVLQTCGAAVAGMAGCVGGVRRSETFSYERDAPVDGPVAHPWQTRAHDARRSGFTRYGWLPQDVAVDRFTSVRQPITTQPAFVDGVAYSGARRLDPDLNRWRSGVEAIDQRGRGWFLYQRNPVASPTVVGDAIFVTSAGLTRALDRRDGTFCWAYRQGSNQPTGSPTVADGTVYVTDGRVFALAATTGEVRWATDRWDTTLRGTAASGEGVFVTAGRDGRGSVTRLEPATGRELWSTSTQSEVLVSSVVGELIYVVEATGRLRALDPSDGGEVWTHELGGLSSSAPALARGTVYAVPTEGNTLQAFAASTGELRWETTFDGRNAMDLTVTVDTVYLPVAGDGGGFIHAFSVDTGTLLRSHDLPREPVSALIVGEGAGLVAAGTSPTSLYRLGRSDE